MRRLVTLVVLLLSFGLDAYAWRPLTSQEAGDPASFSAPALSIQLEDSEVVLGERLTIRVVVENRGDDEIKSHLTILETASMGASLWMTGLKPHPQPYVGIRVCGEPKDGVLEAQERIGRDLAVSYAIDRPGGYELHASYVWRGQLHRGEDPAARSVESSAGITVSFPSGVDADAMRWASQAISLGAEYQTFGETGKLAILQDEGLEFMADGAVNQARRDFLARFPESTFARHVRLALARSLRLGNNFEEAELVFEEYLEKHADSWLADEALLGRAECEIELGKPKEAEATLRELVDRADTDGGLLAQALRVEKSLAAGHRTLRAIYEN